MPKTTRKYKAPKGIGLKKRKTPKVKVKGKEEERLKEKLEGTKGKTKKARIPGLGKGKLGTTSYGEYKKLSPKEKAKFKVGTSKENQKTISELEAADKMEKTLKDKNLTEAERKAIKANMERRRKEASDREKKRRKSWEE